MFLDHFKAPRGLNHWRASGGACERASVQDEPPFVNDIATTRCVLLISHRIPLKEFTSLRKKPEGHGGLFPVWGYPWVQPENTTTQPQAEDLFWRWVSLKSFIVQGLKELREGRLMSCVLDQRDLGIEFAHLIAKRQLHSVMEGLRQQSKSSAQDERGYGSVNPGTVHRKAAKKPLITYAPTVADPRSHQPSGSQPEVGLPAPTRVTPPFHKQLVLPMVPPPLNDSHHIEVGLAVPIKEGSSSSRTRLSTRLPLSRILLDPQLRVGTLWGPALGLGPGGQAAAQAAKSEALEVLRQDLDALCRETQELHGRVDRRVPASALKELRQGLDALSHEVHGRMPSYEPQGAFIPLGLWVWLFREFSPLGTVIPFV
ncbi:Hypothetical protein PHPALM_7089 [Phytophthora palmivora]|uniref:ATP-binding cassette (ABC) Superfamily n=1 Tax=Phytophthora palmivora TaxID=4796 RepID=A0A2P4YD77_9STRA|nr:Hypothetical protein PHPALM_7089 [Phytophthora palmivora]